MATRMKVKDDFEPNNDHQSQSQSQQKQQQSLQNKNSPIGYFACILLGCVLVKLFEYAPIHDVQHLAKETTTKQPSARANMAFDGWSQIDVFYGDRDHFDHNRENESKSQVRQDKIVVDLLNGLEKGYFVDLAANDPTYLSNTFMLETKYNWNGLCIEPNSKYWSRLAYRKCQVVGAVIGPIRMEKVDFQFGEEGSQSVVNFALKTKGLDRGEDRGVFGGIIDEEFDNKSGDKKIVVERYTMTLEEMFDRYNTPPIIDYLSLDVEGAEYYIMESFPFHKYKFKVMTIERPNDDLKSLLKDEGYMFVKNLSDWGETLWIKKEFKSELFY